MKYILVIGLIFISGACKTKNKEVAQMSNSYYTCSMHPQIVKEKPGKCPICGMTLEPRFVSSGENISPELADMTRRFWISVALTIPLILIEMSDMFPGQPLQVPVMLLEAYGQIVQ